MAAALTIAAREARVITRRARTWHLRWIIGALGIVAMLAAFWLSRYDAAAQGNFVFVSIGVVAQLYATFAGVIVAADAIAAERREQTLGLLFLTDLRPRHVLLGKWLTASTTTICGLLVIVPLLAVPMLMGGIAPERVAMLAGELVNTLLLSLSVGFLVSSLFRSGWSVLTIGIVWMLTIAILIPALMMYLEMGEALAFISPTCGLLALVSETTVEREQFWQSVFFNHAVLWANLAIVSLRLVYIWRDRPATARQQKRQARLSTLRFGARRARLKLRAKLLDQNALSWLVNREQMSSSILMAAFGAMFFALLVALYFCQSYELIQTIQLALWSLVLAHGALLFRIAMSASYDLAEDRKSGALELLLSTPLRPIDIVHGRWLGIYRRFFGPIAILLFFQIVMILAMLANLEKATWQTGFWAATFRLEIDAAQTTPFALIVAALIAPLNWIAAGWMGMWLGLRARKSFNAIWITLQLVLFPPLILLAATCGTIVALGWHESRIDLLNPAKIGLAAWVFSAVNTGVWMHLGQRNLLKYFRAAAGDRLLDYKPPFPWATVRRWTWQFAALLAMLAVTIIYWRASSNRRAENAWREALAAHPEFSMSAMDIKGVVVVNPKQNLAQCALLKPLDKPRDTGRAKLYARRNIIRETFPILGLRNPFTASFPGNTNASIYIPQPNNTDRAWLRGEFQNLQILESYAIKRGILARRAASPSRSILEIYERFASIISELHEEAARRPETQFAYYPIHLNEIMTALGYRAIARLRIGESAIDDLTLMLRLIGGCHDLPESSYYGMLPTFQPLFEGLAQRRWNDEELKQIQELLGRISYWQTLSNNIVRATRGALGQLESNGPDMSKESHFYRAAYFFSYEAKLARAKATILNRGLETFPRMVDMNRKAIDLRIFREAITDIEMPEYLPGPTLPDNIAGEVALFGHMQTTIDLVRVACALERYRLWNFRFPDTLSELEPQFIEHVPLDIMTGRPLIYQQSEDGQRFEIYSFGIDGIDNGGKVGELGESRRVDWVWNPLKRPGSSPGGSRGE